MAENILLAKIQEETLQGLEAIKAYTRSILDALPQDDLAARTLRLLSIYLGERSEAITMLVSWGYCWDAEIVLRCFYETAAKIQFIASAEAEGRNALAEEYWDTFSQLADRRRALKAEHAQTLFEMAGDNDSADIFKALRNAEFFKTDALGTKKIRKEIEQKWSFSEILKTLEIRSITGAQSLLHMYGLASHLLHADQAALDLMIDRAIRDEGERKLLEASHMVRIWTDQLSLQYFSTYLIAKAYSIEGSGAEPAMAATDKVCKMAEPITSSFSDSQRDFYNSLRS